MKEMSEDEVVDFLMKGTRTGKITTVRKDNSPHVAPIWFVWNEGKIIFCTSISSVKAKNIRHNPKVSFCVDDDSPPYAFVIIEGNAKFSDEQKNLLKWNTFIGGRYMGKELADVYGKRNSTEGEVLIEILPTKTISDKDVSGW